MNKLDLRNDKKEKINSFEGAGKMEIANPRGRVLVDIDVWGENSEDSVIDIFTNLLGELKEAIEEPFILTGSEKRVEIKVFPNLNLLES